MAAVLVPALVEELAPALLISMVVALAAMFLASGDSKARRVA